GVAGSVVVVGAAGEGPVRGAAWDIGEAGARVEAGGEVRPAHTGRMIQRRAVRVAVIDAGVAVDQDARVGLVDDDGGVAGSVVVVGAAGEGPVCRATWDIGEAGAQVDAGGEVRPAHTGRMIQRRAVRVAVIDAGVAVDQDARVGLVDDDGGVAGSVVVVGAAGEGPV